MASPGVTLIRSGRQLLDITGAAGLLRYRTEQESARLAALEKLPRKLLAESLSAHRFREEIQRALAEKKGCVFVFAVVANDERRVAVCEFIQGMSREEAIPDEAKDSSLIARILEAAPRPGVSTGPATHQVEDFGVLVFEGDGWQKVHGSVAVTAQHIFPGSIEFASGHGDPRTYHQFAAMAYDYASGETPNALSAWLHSQEKQTSTPVAAQPVTRRNEQVAHSAAQSSSTRPLVLAGLSVIGLIFLAIFLLASSAQHSSPVRGASPSSFRSILGDFNLPFPGLNNNPKPEPAPVSRTRFAPRPAALPSERSEAVQHEIALPAIEEAQTSAAVPALPAIVPASASAQPALRDDASRRAAALQALGVGGQSEARKRAAISALTGKN